MPLVTISAMIPRDSGAVPRTIQDVRDAGALALSCSRSNIWVVFQPIHPGHYVQGEGEPALCHGENSHPPIVIVRAQAGRPPEIRKAFAEAISYSVSKGLDIPPENIWIHYQEMSPQDVWFDGRWTG